MKALEPERTWGGARHGPAAVLLAGGLYLTWVAATYLLEGLPRTLLRPEAAGLRLLYAVVANILVGTVLTLWVVRGLTRGSPVGQARVGFRRGRRVAVSLFVGAALGLGAYAAQGAPSLHPVVLANGFAQVLVVSIAEILVCWVAAGGAVQLVLRHRSRALRLPALVVVPAALFGVYHFAHSPPFDTPGMVALLSVVGVVTGVFFLVARELYGTIVFHNFLALFGVLQAVQRTVGLESYHRVQWPLVGTALAASAILILAERSWIRAGREGP